MVGILLLLQVPVCFHTQPPESHRGNVVLSIGGGAAESDIKKKKKTAAFTNLFALPFNPFVTLSLPF
jgi:hypothetical protein